MSQSIPFRTNISGKKLELLVELLKEIYDPEIGINIYDLGLIYEVVRDEGSNIVTVKMAFTNPLCPLASHIAQQVSDAVKRVFPDSDVRLELVVDPPWTPKRMTEEGRKRFRELYGYDIAEQ